MNADRFKYKEITDIILRSFYEAQLINYLKATNIEEPCSPAGTGSYALLRQATGNALAIAV